MLMSRKCRYFVYIMASKSRVLYVGVTGGLMSRVLRHKGGEGGSFTQKYKVSRLVWFQTFASVGYAITHETKPGGARRKIALIVENNPTWEDLAAGWGKRVELAYRPSSRKAFDEKQVPQD
jgi:putative endonuclease